MADTKDVSIRVDCLYGVGVIGNLTGQNATHIIIDDPHAPVSDHQKDASRWWTMTDRLLKGVKEDQDKELDARRAKAIDELKAKILSERGVHESEWRAQWLDRKLDAVETPAPVPGQRLITLDDE